MKLDVRIMASRKRQTMVNAMLGQLGAREDIVAWDDRPNGGDAMYTARKAWLSPWEDGITHRLVLQDDLELCHGFLPIVSKAVSLFPDAIFSLYNGRLQVTDRKGPSPYVLLRGAAIWGQAVLIPKQIVLDVFAWIERELPPGYPHDDRAISFFATKQNIRIFSTIPSLVQHGAPNASLLKYNNPRKISKVWSGADVSREDWNAADYSVGGPYIKPLL